MDNIELRLAKLSRNRDRDAFEQLVILYKDRIYNLGYRMLNDRFEAEDIVQETFLRAYKNLDKFDGMHKFSTWIYRKIEREPSQPRYILTEVSVGYRLADE